MRETLHSQNLVHIAEEMQLGNKFISRSVKVRTDTQMNIMKTEALSGHGLNVTGVEGQQKPIATNTSQRITGTRARQKGEPMSKSGMKGAHFWNGPGCVDEYVTAWQYMPDPYQEEKK